MNHNYQTIVALLEKHQILYKEFDHPPILSYEDAEREKAIHHWEGVESKNVFIQGKSGKYYVFVTVFGEKVDFAKLKELLGEKCSVGERSEVEKITGCVPGCVSPFGFSEDITIIVDPKIFEYRQYLFSPGVTTKTIQVNIQDLKPVFEQLPNVVLMLQAQ